MKFLRSIKRCRSEKKRNVVIREEIKIDITGKVAELVENWESHIVRMNASNIPGHAYELHTIGRRNFGRRWKESVFVGDIRRE